jgi:SAM-dependent methyltransferase
MPSRPDSQAFRDFEHAGWERAAEVYHRTFSPLTAQAVEPLLDAAGAGPGVSLLDVATGPGQAAATAAARGARVVGLDFSRAMLALARRWHPDIEFRQGEAECLPFPDAAFEAVVMNFVLLHLARPEQALREACRVLRPGGRVALSVWAKPEEAVVFGIVLGAVRNHGTLEVPLPPGPPFFRFSDREECEGTLRAAGFEAPRVAKVPMVWRLPSADAVIEAMADGTARTGPLLRAQNAEALRAIYASIREAVRRYETGRGLALPMPAVLASGVKPEAPV